MSCRILIDGNLPKPLCIGRAELKAAAAHFAAKSEERVGQVFREVTIILQDDAFSAEVHEAINGVEGPTDVITQRHDSIPGEQPGIYGELYVNTDQAIRAAPHRKGWSTAKELLLYVAHGMDHLSGADDVSPQGYNAMRRRELGWLREYQCEQNGGADVKIAAIDKALKAEFKAHQAPIIELIEAQTHDPFCVLVGTILSARTKDACTAGAVKRLFAAMRREGGLTPDALERLSAEEIEKLVYPVGFYRDKARHLKRLPSVLRERFDGMLPNTVEELCELPGVGRKTANLTVAVGFDLPAICVDVHVHRISNRLGLVDTKTPFETEMALRKLLPVKYWKTWNSHLVSFGQTRCAPLRPKCEGCPIREYCSVPED